MIYEGRIGLKFQCVATTYQFNALLFLPLGCKQKRCRERPKGVET